jgi:hypothetical protein
MSLFKVVIFAVLFLCSIAFASSEDFARKDIVFPVGKSEIEKFLNLLIDLENQKIVQLPKGKVSYKEIPEEGSSLFALGSGSYMLYWDDFNNDGKKEYLVIYTMSGSGNYSGVQGAYSLDGKKLSTLKFDDIVVSNLFPGKDMSRFHSYLANPFAVRKDGHILLRFIADIKKPTTSTYLWNGTKFSKAEVNIPL